MEKLLLLLSIMTLFLVGCNFMESKESKKEQVSEEEPSSIKAETTEHEEVSEPENTSDSEKTTPVTTNSDSTTSSSVDLAEDFTAYLDEIILLAPEEERLIGLYDSVTGANYVNDEIMYNTLINDLLPGYRQFVIDLETIMPKHQRIRDLHETYIDAANIQYNAFTLMISALEEQNVNTMNEANQNLDEARKMIREWLYGMEDLSIETGVSLD